MICNRHDVVVVPFPFTDKRVAKRRPALVLSNTAFNKSGHTILAMITTKQHPAWPGDLKIRDYKSAGLSVSCIIRLKLFTLDNRLILKKLSSLAHHDANRIGTHLLSYLSELPVRSETVLP